MRSRRNSQNQEPRTENRAFPVALLLPASPRHFLSITASHFPVPSFPCCKLSKYVASSVFPLSPSCTCYCLSCCSSLVYLLWGVSSFPFHNLGDFCLTITYSFLFCIQTIFPLFLCFQAFPPGSSFRFITCRNTHKLNNHSVPECVKKNST